MRIPPESYSQSSSQHMKEGDLSSLDKEEKKRLVRWMARIMEKAYRRGVQQALHLLKNEKIDEWITNDPYSYRYEKSLDISIGLDGFTSTSIERLQGEEDLFHHGLWTAAQEEKDETPTTTQS